MWLLPTISRPEKCAAVLKRLIDHGCSTPGCVVVEGDGEGYTDLPLPKDWKVIFTKDYTNKKLGSIGTFNFAFNFMPEEPWYGLMGDDEFLMPDSPADWDRRLIMETGKWDIAHGWENLNFGKRAQGYCCIGGDLVRAVGYLGVPACWHNFGVDCMWEWLSAPRAFGGGECLQNILVPEIKIEHTHYKLGTADRDSCYQNADEKFEQDKIAFTKWQAEEMEEIARRVSRWRRMYG